MKPYIIIILAVLCASSCKKAEEKLFDHAANVYFDIHNGDKDSILRTFAYTPTLPQDTVWLPVRLAGIRTEENRTFTARVETDSSSAVAGQHYEALKPSYSIAAGKGLGYIPLVIYNKDKALENQSVSVIIKLTGTPELGIENPYLIRAKVVFSAKLEKPDWWDFWPLPPYSRTKHELFFLVTGQQSMTREGLDAPKNLYYVGLLNTMLGNPFNWVTKNPLKKYVIEAVTAGSTDQYYFYNTDNPAKKTLMKKNVQNGKYYFIDENGNEVI
ncbi:DUF4843 domain-containing protein [Pedobacter psychroterrae]|uniref:DUF4843 domain-containing protein n=1 Tax=Pedobacter psychroterrae TaxID=2530453 RepID=A0A4R0NS92_9SPHI|nr:DUF4843 domain-containing protein [Pedobacter psychroterrae]TCD02763.1 DUF4843 domain-containing protein [Pedobacter psychroterrae]